MYIPPSSAAVNFSLAQYRCRWSTFWRWNIGTTAKNLADGLSGMFGTYRTFGTYGTFGICAIRHIRIFQSIPEMLDKNAWMRYNNSIRENVEKF